MKKPYIKLLPLIFTFALSPLALSTSIAQSLKSNLNLWEIETCGNGSALPDTAISSLMQKQENFLANTSKTSSSEKLVLSSDGRSNIVTTTPINDLVPTNLYELKNLNLVSSFSIRYFFVDKNLNRVYFHYSEKLPDSDINLNTMIVRKNKTIASCPIKPL